MKNDQKPNEVHSIYKSFIKQNNTNIDQKNNCSVVDKLSLKIQLALMHDIEKEEFIKKVADRVKDLRLKKNKTQLEALNETGIQFSRIEQGKRDISISTLKKLCNYFELTLHSFFDNSNFDED